MASNGVAGGAKCAGHWALTAALCALTALSCASVRPPRTPYQPTTSGVVERPESSADYDVLVGEFAAREGKFAEARDAFARAVVKDPNSARLHNRLARLYAQLDDATLALEHAQRAHELEPDDIETRLFLARLYRVQNDPAGIESALVDATGEPVDTTAALFLYQMYLENDRLEEALVLAQSLAAQDAEGPNGYIAIASIQERLGQYEEAEASLRSALELHPDPMVIYARIARLYRKAGDTQAEIAIYREVLALDTKHHGSLVGLGEALVEAERVDEAIAVFEIAVEHHPEDLQLVRRLASLYFATERLEAAAEILEQAIASHPEASELLFSLGQVRSAMKDDAAALDTLRKVSAEHPIYPETRLQIARIFEEEQDYVAALAEVELVRELRPSRELEFHTAGLLARAGRPEEGIALLESLLTNTPADEEVLYQLGVLHGMADRTTEALDYMRATLAINPDNINALNYVGYTFAEMGESLDEAETMIRRALELRPEDGYITDSLGWVFYKRALGKLAKEPNADVAEDLEQALLYLSEAMVLSGGDPVISEHLGDVYLMMDDKLSALERYEAAVELRPRVDEQPDLLTKLEKLRKELSEQ